MTSSKLDVNREQTVEDAQREIYQIYSIIYTYIYTCSSVTNTGPGCSVFMLPSS